jgi:hypothetical protein
MKEYVIADRSALVTIADHLRNYTGETRTITLGEFVDGIDDVFEAGGINTSDATAQASDILSGETAYVDGEKVTGTIPNNGAISSTMDGIDVKTITIPKGYTSGGTVKLDNTIDNEVSAQTDLISQIAVALADKTAGGVALPELTNEGSANDLLVGKELIDGDGNIVTGAFTIDSELSTQDDLISQIQTALQNKTSVSEPVLQSKTVMPTASSQIVSPDSGYDGLSEVVVEGDADLVADNIKSGVTIFGVSGAYVGGGSGSEESEAIIDGTILTYTNNAVSEVRSGLFMGCSNLTTVNLPNCTKVGAYAFNSCKKLTSISFPCCITIGDNAFTNCDALTNVDMPQCTSIPMSGFTSCDSLKSINLPMCLSMANYAFNYCKVLTDVNIPACHTLNNSVFSNCYSLSTISLPSISNIAPGVFNKCYNLKSLYLMGSSLCKLSNSNAFLSTPIGGYSASAGAYGSIYVPASMLASYQTATNWTYFSNRFVGIGEDY